jgi:hypothetical protein
MDQVLKQTYAEWRLWRDVMARDLLRRRAEIQMIAAVIAGGRSGAVLVRTPPPPSPTAAEMAAVSLFRKEDLINPEHFLKVSGKPVNRMKRAI